MVAGRKQLEHLMIETSFVYDVISEGEQKPITYADLDAKEITEVLKDEILFVLYTGEIAIPSVLDGIAYAGLLLDQDLVVQKTFETTGSDKLILADGNLGVLIVGKNQNLVKEAVGKFHAGDMVKLKFHGISISAQEAVALTKDDGTQPMLMLDYVDMFTTTESTITVKGEVLHLEGKKQEQVKIQIHDDRNQLADTYECKMLYDKADSHTENTANFNKTVTLLAGVNYIDVVVTGGQKEELCRKSMIVFRKLKEENTCQKKQSILWVEQYVSASLLNTPERIRKLVMTAKEAGVTAFSLDVKGCEGFAAYKKATRTHVPYITASCNPKKQITMEIDFLEEFTKIAHELDCKVYASLNFFVEGNLKSQDFAIQLPKTHPEWAEVLQVPEDEGRLVSVLETKRDCMLCYVNPANDEVVEFELLRAKEVIENYDVDGIVLDRTRYDNQFADFSEETKQKFITYLTSKQKELINWPQDIYSFDEEKKMVFGPLYLEWITFRAGIIQQFAAKLRHMIDEFNRENHKAVGMAAYVGSWYELYYQNGVNWASSDFQYNERLKFPVAELYSKEYSKTSYLDSIDFLMIGCYYATREQIEKYLTLGNILTNGKVPLVGSISLPHLTTKETQRIGYQACYDASEGCMIFDLCYVDWEKLKFAMN